MSRPVRLGVLAPGPKGSRDEVMDTLEGPPGLLDDDLQIVDVGWWMRWVERCLRWFLDLLLKFLVLGEGVLD